MQTEIGERMLRRFPSVYITEEIMSDDSYWVNVRVGGHWVVIQKTTNQGIGLSITKEHTLDFGGHDQVVSEIDNAVEWAASRINEFLAE